MKHILTREDFLTQASHIPVLNTKRLSRTFFSFRNALYSCSFFTVDKTNIVYQIKSETRKVQILGWFALLSFEKSVFLLNIKFWYLLMKKQGQAEFGRSWSLLSGFFKLCFPEKAVPSWLYNQADRNTKLTTYPSSIKTIL